MNIERHDKLYKEGCELIGPSMILDAGEGELVETEVNETQIKKGIKILEEVIEINPNNWVAYWTTGKGYQALEDHQAAYKSFLAAYKAGHKVHALRELVRECLYVEKLNEAIYYANLATELEPNDAGLQANFALCLLLAKKIDRALEVAEASLIKDPNDKITQQIVNLIKDIKANKIEMPKSLLEIEQL